jgi:hypothetical protein
MKAPLEDPVMAEFATGLAEVNAIADRSLGFIWRLQSSSGNATDIRAYPDPRMLVNLSVWQSVEQLISICFLDATLRPPQPPLVRGEQEKHL